MAPQSLDLGLSLGLGLAAPQPSLSFCYSGNSNVVAMPDQREVSPPAAAEERRCSPAGSPVSSGSGKRAAERSAGSGDEDDDGAGGRKKLRLSKDQAAVLEECFKTHHTLTPKQKLALANSLGLRPRQVEVWFQNRRARTKLKQTEVDCEYLKRWCEQLAEENRRLGKEVAELRALNAVAPAAPPLTTLSMCLSCRRVASSSPNTATNNNGLAAHQQHAAANAGVMASPTMAGHRQFFCGFREAGTAAYGASSGLSKAVKAAR
ncbi:hypothetical protein PR202_ga18216 [Eleusine coracana subsp. coracana]|uniref:Homeobox domain-containing protein n=1 Tax=Eleusine coracana subsp. coracana TaxID=191504 RepID=A0AAV5CSY7_ELECO|nr:hypothetical protein QOZ80_6AG0508100 [Eleusine coracana subsp. coracana]GJN00987.1 hypothetical protein PR202_ga18216 [Eleusine coracana subsp. coracana]